PHVKQSTFHVYRPLHQEITPYRWCWWVRRHWCGAESFKREIHSGVSADKSHNLRPIATKAKGIASKWQSCVELHFRVRPYIFIVEPIRRNLNISYYDASVIVDTHPFTSGVPWGNIKELR